MNTKEADADVYLELHRIMSEESKDKNPKPMKYIDADKLKAEIERRIAQWQPYTFACASQIASEAFDRIDELKGLLIFITSLQLEQPFAGPAYTPNRTPKLQGEALAKAKGLTAYEVKEGVTIYAKNEAEAIKRAKKRGLL